MDPPRCVDVVGVQVDQVVGKTARERARLEPQQPRGVAVPLDPVARDVPDPGDNTERFLRKLKLLRALRFMFSLCRAAYAATG